MSTGDYLLICIEFCKGKTTAQCGVCKKRHTYLVEAKECLKQAVNLYIQRGYNVFGGPKIQGYGLMQAVVKPSRNMKIGTKVKEYELIQMEYGIRVMTNKCSVCQKPHSNPAGVSPCMTKAVESFMKKGWIPWGDVCLGQHFVNQSNPTFRYFCCQAVVLPCEEEEKEVQQPQILPPRSDDLKRGPEGYVY